MGLISSGLILEMPISGEPTLPRVSFSPKAKSTQQRGIVTLSYQHLSFAQRTGVHPKNKEAKEKLNSGFILPQHETNISNNLYNFYIVLGIINDMISIVEP